MRLFRMNRIETLTFLSSSSSSSSCIVKEGGKALRKHGVFGPPSRKTHRAAGGKYESCVGVGYQPSTIANRSTWGQFYAWFSYEKIFFFHEPALWDG